MQLKVLSNWLLLAPILVNALAVYTEQELFSQEESQFENYKPYDPFTKPYRPHQQSPFGPAHTVYEIIASNPRFSVVTKAINFVEDIAELLNDTSSHLTFFAPPDRVLRRPRGTSHSVNLTIVESLRNAYASLDHYSIVQNRDFSEVLPLLEEIASERGEEYNKRKKFLKAILRAVLSYHILPGNAQDLSNLGRNITHPTHLQIPGAFSGEPLRLRVTRSIFQPAFHVNFFTKILFSDIKAANGIIHVVDHAVVPPPSVFQELYLIPAVFSTLTSALQRSNLTSNVDLRYTHGQGFEGASLVTVFAPTNRAFQLLPKKLQLFLFSPFGENVLKKLLQYHIVPDAVIHSNYRNCVEEHMVDVDEQVSFIHLLHQNHARPRPPGHVEPIFTMNLTLNTLLQNYTINTQIIQNKLSFPSIPGQKKYSIIDTKVVADGRPAIVTDVVSLNGAIHVVDKLLDPRKKHGHHGYHDTDCGELNNDHAYHEGHACEMLFGSLLGSESIEGCRTRCGKPLHPSRNKHQKAGSRSGSCQRNRKERKHRQQCPCDDEYVDQDVEISLGDRHAFSDGLHCGENCQHDSWADWESWLPQWAEQN